MTSPPSLLGEEKLGSECNEDEAEPAHEKRRDEQASVCRTRNKVVAEEGRKDSRS